MTVDGCCFVRVGTDTLTDDGTTLKQSLILPMGRDRPRFRARIPSDPARGKGASAYAGSLRLRVRCKDVSTSKLAGP